MTGAIGTCINQDTKQFIIIVKLYLNHLFISSLLSVTGAIGTCINQDTNQFIMFVKLYLNHLFISSQLSVTGAVGTCTNQDTKQFIMFVKLYLTVCLLPVLSDRSYWDLHQPRHQLIYHVCESLSYCVSPPSSQ